MTQPRTRFVPDGILAKPTQPTPIFVCYCCGERYLRGHFRCCAPPANMASHVWLGKHCRQCADDSTGLRSKCPRHCTCARVPALDGDSLRHATEAVLGQALAGVHVWPAVDPSEYAADEDEDETR
jgi:hypothetical protein